VIRRTIGVAAAVALVLAAFVLVTGGTRIAVAGLHVSATDPIRPFVAAALLGAMYAFVSGRKRLADDRRSISRLATPARASLVLAVAIGVLAVWQTSWAASGSDAHAYVTQADLWLAGRLTVHVPIANDVPWPAPLSTFVPFGYAAVANESAIAPIVGPGLPLLMAAMKAVAGHAALFLVVPITAALLIWATFGIGRQLGSARLGLGAAWLVATSPAFLTMIKEPMSDVPAAAFWALATWKVLDESRFSAALAGIATAMAILIRPNLVPLAAVLGAWMLWRRHKAPRADRIRAASAFAAGVVPACLAIAWINQTIFGAPLASGYGSAADLFSIANMWTNVTRYGGWLMETQTPLVFAGMLALVVPSTHLWPTVEMRSATVLLAALTIAVCAIYASYIPVDAWWFLRFLLPCWPALCIGTVAVLRSASQFAGSRARAVEAIAIVVLGLYTAFTASRLRVFPDNEGERRYATVAQLVQQATEPSSIILASIHAGPLRYYAGRDTIRFDLLNEEWLDRAVAWLTEQGRHPYILIEDWERPLLEKRFAASNSLGRLALSPVLAYRAYQISGTVYLFDPARPAAQTWEPPPIRNPQPRCPLPAPAPGLSLHPQANL
jgi:Dolichyl-phosphate-mannose-protein mannosyltransferase